MIRLIILCYLVGFSLAATAGIGLQDAIKQGLVTAKIQGQGGFTGKVLSIELTNTQAKYITVDVPTGLQMQSADSSIQDLIITEGVQFVLGARGTKKMVVNAMCIQPHHGSPYANSAFMVGNLAADTLLKLVQYIATKRYQDELGQSAVWTLIKDEGLENVYGPDQTKLKDLLVFMNKLTGKPLPWYNKQTLPPPPGQVRNQEVAILHGIYNFNLTEKGFAKLAVYDVAGKEMFLFVEKMEVFPGENRIKFKLEVQGYGKGKYYARLMVDGVLKEEKVFEI